MPEANLSRVNVPAYDIDFVEQFGRSMRGLQEVLGVSRMHAVPIGSTVKTYSSTVTLAGGAVEPGAVIPLSEVVMEPAETIEMTYDKRRKAVPVEDIQKVGYDNAVARTDERLIRELRGNILTGFYTFLNTGTGAVEGENLQATMARAGGATSVAFEDDVIEKIAFINPMDLAEYQADHQVTLETQNGLSYLTNFLGYNRVIVTSSVEQGKVIATAADNINFYYADVNGEIKKAFPSFYSDAAAPMVGVAHSPTYERLQSETVTLSAVLIAPERLDGIVIGTIAEDPSV